MESNHTVKKRFSHSKGNFSKSNYKYGNAKEFVEKKKNSDYNIKCRMLPDINGTEEMTIDQFSDELCTNLHEHNKILMCKLNV